MVEIRKAEEKDCEQILKMIFDTPELLGMENSEDTIHTREFVLSYISDKKNRIALVAEEKEKVIGFLFSDLSTYSYLADLVILPEFKGRGIATKLMQEHESICKNLGIKILIGLVQSENRYMQKFLENKNFKKGKSLIQFQKSI